MEQYLTSVFNIMYQMQPGYEASSGVSASELAKATAAKVRLLSCCRRVLSSLWISAASRLVL